MEVRYRHTFTVVVEGVDNFDESASMAKVIEYGARDAAHVTLLVKRGGTEPKPVRSSVVTQTVIIHGSEE